MFDLVWNTLYVFQINIVSDNELHKASVEVQNARIVTYAAECESSATIIYIT